MLCSSNRVSALGFLGRNPSVFFGCYCLGNDDISSIGFGGRIVVRIIDLEITEITVLYIVNQMLYIKELPIPTEIFSKKFRSGFIRLIYHAEVIKVKNRPERV